jgi:hypothetical protein
MHQANSLENQAKTATANLGLPSACSDETTGPDLVNLVAQLAALPTELRKILAKSLDTQPD